jgi:hypothetical protein
MFTGISKSLVQTVVLRWAFLGLVGRLPIRRSRTVLVQEKPISDRLRELCGSDSELYNALSYAIVERPEEREPVDAYLSRAIAAEQHGDSAIAYSNYLIAGQISLFQGKQKDAKRCFTKCMELSKEPGKVFLPLIQRIDKALEIADEYYQTMAERTR